MTILALKAGGLAALVALIFGAGFYFGGLGPKAKLADYHAQASADLARAYATQRADAQKRQDAYDKEIANLKALHANYPGAPIPISMCASARLIVPTTGSSGPADTTSGVLPPIPGPVPAGRVVDIEPFVFGLADRADELAARCRL